MFKAFARSLREFRLESRGNVAILFGLALIPILMGLGAAIDYGRALIVRERMADAADAAALAIGSWPGLTDSELQTKAQQFFDANYPPSQIGTVGKISVAAVGEDIKVNVKGEVPTTFMQLANIDSVGIDVSATITKKQRNIEVVLVLDITGSMNSGGKLSAMKNAATKMVETLFDGKSTSDTLKIGLVPFSAAVNVGTDKENSGWIDTAKYPGNSSIAKEDFAFTSGQSAFTLLKDLNKNWSGCVRERAEPYELTDDPPGGAAATKWAPYFAPDEPNTSNNSCNTSYTNSYIRDGSWAGTVCPDPADTSNAAKRQCFTGKYKNSISCSQGTGPQYNCSPSPVVAMTNIKSTIVNKINGLSAGGYTVIPAGLLWGWRLISPGEPFTEGSPYNDDKWIKAIVLLTDGDNDVNGGGNGHDRSDYNAFGYARSGHLGLKSGSNAEATLDAKALTVCSAIKAKDIRLYTIGFQVSSNAQNLLKTCATKTDMYYNSPSNDQLAAIFQDIAQGLSELRIAE